MGTEERREHDIAPGYNMTDFRDRVFDAVRTIPAGEVRTYGDIAEMVGSPGGARAVGQALSPLDLDADHGVPFWRVVLSDGAVNTAAAEAEWPDAVAQVRRRLADEGVAFSNDGRVASLAGRTALHTGSGGARSAVRKQVAPEPCWRHQTIQYSCRDCAPRPS